ncbi:MAG: hypothetical protein EPO40_05685 [Myxococcaceae bacterium]|nr:MAG: hypothetical protein EPO40_05685 [Myxococcaceae bacterium]
MRRIVTAAMYALALVAYLALGWIPGVVLVLLALVGTLRALASTARELAPHALCGRGHVTPTYGLVRCSACGFTGEGSVWRCSHCDAAYGHTPCSTCGLSIRNPSL